MTPNFEHHKYLQHIANDKYPDSYIITDFVVICRKTLKDLFGGTLKKLILPPEYEVIVGFFFYQLLRYFNLTQLIWSAWDFYVTEILD